MKRLLLLWDVDGTLIDDGHVGETVYPLAFERLTGRSARHRVTTAGRTEPEIMDELFHRHGVGRIEESRVAAELTAQLQRRAAALRTAGRTLPGAVAALRAMRAQRHVAQSVLTGNLRANALLKLRLFGLAEYLDLTIGAYGGDARARAELVPVAQRRAAAAYGREFDADSTVLIGDTPLDVRAGLVGGARVIAVASGASSAAALREAGADTVLATLRDTGAVIHAVQAPGPTARSPR
ncbi:haloacid dehalogenase-like hydrolase [Kitasatospora sp. A2-31]|uniref:HAD family hydrolase n=1 Tax=Kitasatospora sp. A2-31 TaxID=2916414 RepID=UPI001EEA265B|nr:haloacid dehalogenase-like hydrolase [Kitasatospora sp. A2-31]MCG6494302.1 haloacid dehalogenase-like hydrolase [Kitasatospora sp. A2-31]